MSGTKNQLDKSLPNFKYIKYFPYPHLVKTEVLPAVQSITVALCGFDGNVSQILPIGLVHMAQI